MFQCVGDGLGSERVWRTFRAPCTIFLFTQPTETAPSSNYAELRRRRHRPNIHQKNIEVDS